MLTKPTKLLCPNSLEFVDYASFTPDYLDCKNTVLIPSVGIGSTKLTVGRFHQLHEHRQEAEAMVRSSESRVMITQYHPNSSETAYRSELFGDMRPVRYALADLFPSDETQFASQIVQDLRLLEKFISESADSSFLLMGYHETEDMETIAREFGLQFFGNPRFAEWAGSKRGLFEFALEVGVPTPQTFIVQEFSDIQDAANSLRQFGYKRMVVKTNHSIGGQGHSVLPIRKAQTMTFEEFQKLSPHFSFQEGEGGVAQGWIESYDICARVGINITIGLDGASMISSAVETDSSATQFVPLSEEIFGLTEVLIEKIIAGYMQHNAIGPHSINFIVVTDGAVDHLRLPSRILWHDENTRTGATRVGLEWLRCIGDSGGVHTGFRLENIYPRQQYRFSDVLAVLDSAGLLIESRSSSESGIFPYNGVVYEEYPESGFWILSISSAGDYLEAEDLACKVRELFSADLN